jgi:hypothetical protein
VTHHPEPSIWPVTLALGVGIAVVGAIASPVATVAGALITFIAIFGWIAQAIDESVS